MQLASTFTSADANHNKETGKKVVSLTDVKVLDLTTFLFGRSVYEHLLYHLKSAHALKWVGSFQNACDGGREPKKQYFLAYVLCECPLKRTTDIITIL